jgi:hypothetical protein
MRCDSSKTKHLPYVMATCDAFKFDAGILDYREDFMRLVTKHPDINRGELDTCTLRFIRKHFPYM